MKRKAFLISAALLIAMCDPGPDPDRCAISDPDKLIEITYPRGGESFRHGQDVKIQWKADTLDLSSIGIQYSLNGGPWRFVSGNSIPIIPDGSEAACMEYKWKIGGEWEEEGEYEPGEYSLPDSARIRIFDYQDQQGTYDTTETFFIKAN